MKTFTYIIIIIFLIVSNIYSQWVETESPYQNGITDISFINPNTGFASTAEINNSNKNYFLKTTNKGLNWVFVYEISSGDHRSSIDFINEFTGYFSQHYLLIKTTNGGVNWFVTYQYNQFNTYPRVRFGDANTGYFAFSKFYTGEAGSGGIYLYRTTNGGNNWNVTSINGYFTNRNSRISDISVSKTNPNLVAICGHQIVNDEYNSIYYSSDNGFATGNESDNSVEIGARFDRITISPQSNDIYILSNKGIYKENLNIISFIEGSTYEQIGINIDFNGKGYAIKIVQKFTQQQIMAQIGYWKLYTQDLNFQILGL